MNINKIKELCLEYGFTPSKQYGQNYLINDGIVEKIIKASEIKPTDIVVEVGPGFGVLTFALAKKAQKVIAFEIEKKLEKYWQENKPENVEIIWGNALNKLRIEDLRLKNYKVVANIPYQITSDLLRTILELENKPESIIIMVQKEVAERICAKKGEMSLLALSVQYYGEPKIVDVVTKGNFWPAPKVDSAILQVRLNLPNPTPNPLLIGEGVFFKFARAGFAFKRKQLWSNLSKGLGLDGGKVKKVLKEQFGNEKIRAEELLVEDWQRLVSKF